MATPRNLDPKFQDEKNVPPVDEKVQEDTTPVEAYDSTTPEADFDKETHIVVRENGEIVHGPIPVSEWTAYEKEHNL